MQHYADGVCGGQLDAASLCMRAPYIDVVRERCRREALAQLRTGSHWGAEETGRWLGLPREQRRCPHCKGDIEHTTHIIFHCPLYASVRQRFSDLFDTTHTSLHTFFQQPAPRLASFAAACKRLWLDTPLPPTQSQPSSTLLPTPLQL